MSHVISRASTVAGRHDQLNARARSAGARRERRGHGVIKDVVLAAFGALGVLAVGWLVFAQITGASIVVFETGSMAPAIGQGGASISFPASATDLKVGDIITAKRTESALPITHRVVKIAADPSNPSGRLVTLKGDANATADIAPYPITETLRVAVGFPGLGTAVTAAKSPFGIGTIFALVALLILWAFWPSRKETSSAEAARAARHRG